MNGLSLEGRLQMNASNREKSPIKNYTKNRFRKGDVGTQLSLLNSAEDTIQCLMPTAREMGIDIKLYGDKRVVISRWQFSKTFYEVDSALNFLQEMGVQP